MPLRARLVAKLLGAKSRFHESQTNFQAQSEGGETSVTVEPKYPEPYTTPVPGPDGFTGDDEYDPVEIGVAGIDSGI